MVKKRDKLVWSPKDILSSIRVSSMTLEEEGAYRRSLDIFYMSGYLPSDVGELAKVIGKGCSLEVAKKVKSMYIVNSKFPLTLTHDYLEKLLDGTDMEVRVSQMGSDEQKERFINQCKMISDSAELKMLIHERYKIVDDDFLKVLREFCIYKMATNQFKSYVSTDDVRRNFIFYVPYSETYKNKNNNGTSKLEQW